MLKEILFVHALLAHLDRLIALLGIEWSSVRDKLLPLLTDLAHEEDASKVAARVHRIFRALEGTPAETLAQDLFHQAYIQAQVLKSVQNQAEGLTPPTFTNHRILDPSTGEWKLVDDCVTGSDETGDKSKVPECRSEDWKSAAQALSHSINLVPEQAITEEEPQQSTEKRINAWIDQFTEELPPPLILGERGGDMEPTLESLRAILQELIQPAKSLHEMPSRVKLCLRALALVNRKENAALWGYLHFKLANCLELNPEGSRADNLEQAIHHYQQALEVRTREAYPEEWAMTQNNLANTFRDWIRGDRAENLERAIDHYQQALEVRTREAYPEEWAITQNNLASAFSDRIRGERAENVEQAIAHYQQALAVFTRENNWYQWAETQNNLANAYLNRIRGERAENLEQAIAHYQQAQAVYAHEANPELRALIRDNLVDAISDRIRGERIENLERAIDIKSVPEQVITEEEPPQSTEKRINAWIDQFTEEPPPPLILGERYTLNLGVGTPVIASLIDDVSANIPAKDLKGGGLQTEWIITTSAFELSSDDPQVVLSAAPPAAPNLWTAKFTLWIPEEGESDVRRLLIIPISSQSSRLEVLIFAIKDSRFELYRQFSIEVPVEAAGVTREKAVGSLIKDDLVHAPSAQMNLRTAHEWTTPPGRLNVAVLPGMLKAYVKGDLPGGQQPDEFVDWYAQQANLAGSITNVREATEKFRGIWKQYLNDIDAQDLLQRLDKFAPTYDWPNWQLRADSQRAGNWDKSSKSQELLDLAISGHQLYETVFPPSSQLRIWMDSLTPGYRVDIFWDESSGPGYVPNVPWGLMYLPEPPAPGESVDPMGFLALRFRLGYRGYRGVSSPSKALGALANAHQAYCLYWGQDPSDETGNEAAWQRQQFAAWENQIFAPQDPTSPSARGEVLQMLSAPLYSPTSVIYFFCQAAVGDGNKPVLRFGATSAAANVLQTIDLLGGKPLNDQPLVFANACTTSAADPYIANLLEQNFFRRGCRGFLGTETKVPIQLASRFATIFFNFFYRKIDPIPMAAGEALAQTRLFLLTEYANIGGIFYTYLNQFELYMANGAEVDALRT